MSNIDDWNALQELARERDQELAAANARAAKHDPQATVNPDTHCTRCGVEVDGPWCNGLCTGCSDAQWLARK